MHDSLPIMTLLKAVVVKAGAIRNNVRLDACISACAIHSQGNNNNFSQKCIPFHLKKVALLLRIFYHLFLGEMWGEIGEQLCGKRTVNSE